MRYHGIDLFGKTNFYLSNRGRNSRNNNYYHDFPVSIFPVSFYFNFGIEKILSSNEGSSSSVADMVTTETSAVTKKLQASLSSSGISFQNAVNNNCTFNFNFK